MHSKETEKLEVESVRHDEIYLILADLKVGMDELRSKVDRYEPMFEYYNKGSILAKAIIGILKWSAATVVTLGAVAGAVVAVKGFFHGQN